MREDIKDSLLKQLDTQELYNEEDIIEQSIKEEIESKYDQLVYLSSRVIKDVGILGEEHRNLKRPFIFNCNNYIEQVQEQQTYFIDYLSMHLQIEVKQSINKVGSIIQS